ncbi:MAG: phosphate ABC transporter permease PstA [Nitrospinaceae bacterium]|nr:MAG: phosphate ABC transporter permease PstA [Nitrospinaceae bacterium]
MTRGFLEKGVLAGLVFMTGFAVFIFALVLAEVAVRGGGALNAGFFLEEARDFGAAGGVRYQMEGTLLLMVGAAALGLPLALAGALFQTEYVDAPGLKRGLRLLVYSMNGVPTILFGLLGYLFFGITLGAGVSWLTGVLILAIMILPTIQVSVQEAIEALPEQYREAAGALGLSRWQVVRSIVLPHCLYGIVTGTLLGLARAAGETAAILFTATAFSGARFPEAMSDPVPTLQTHILVLAQEALNPRTIENAWGAGLVLLCLVFSLIALSLVFRGRLSMEFER